MSNKRHAALTCGYISYPQVSVRIVPNYRSEEKSYAQGCG